ncbi:MAG TPA: ATP-binding protein [Thermoanaerobaculia bacterium]|nr:ATP-binding protein [Thermoanaerobaculia bacterium]
MKSHPVRKSTPEEGGTVVSFDEERHRGPQSVPPGMEPMGRLAGGIAHVFNNMLTAILCEAELALHGLPNDHPARKHLSEVERTGERGATLARQLLAFSGRQVLNPRPLQLNALLRAMEQTLHRILGDRVEIKLLLEPDLERIHADSAQLEQAVLNLAANAREAMAEGGTFTLETTNVAPEGPAGGRRVLLKVCDSGHGMADEVRARAFEPFFTTKVGVEAVGLGLPTVYGIVTQSGGEVLVESAAGEGTRLFLYFPSAEEERHEAGSAARGARGQEWETILLVEDEDNVRKPLAEILASRGYKVIDAADAAQAIALSQGHRGPIHLMVTDVLMAGMSGVELADRLSFQRPEMKVLFATGYPAGLTEGANSLLREEDVPLLKKPFTGRILLAKVREVLDSMD